MMGVDRGWLCWPLLVGLPPFDGSGWHLRFVANGRCWLGSGVDSLLEVLNQVQHDDVCVCDTGWYYFAGAAIVIRIDGSSPVVLIE